MLYLGRTKGNWTRVSTEDGDAGWVLTSKLDIAEPAGAARTRSRSARSCSAACGLGFTLLSQSLSHPGRLDGWRAG